jgi:hypothetical protein
MDERIKFFVGLDAHKDSTSVAVCEAAREPARFVGTIGPMCVCCSSCWPRPAIRPGERRL